MKKRMRLQLLSPEGIPQTDRLVDQATEFYQGPKETHEGIIKVEVTLGDTKDIDDFIQYLNQLRGNLPLKVAGTRGRKPGSTTQPTTTDTGFESREALMKDLLDSADQDQFIDKAREAGFVFVTSEHLLMIADKMKVKSLPDHVSGGKFEYMVRLIRRAKDPLNDKYDLSMIFAIKMISGRSPRMRTWLLGEEGKARLDIPEKAYTFRKTGLIKFPTYMKEDERLKWSREIRLLIDKPEMKPSKFFNRWAKDVQVPDDLQHERFSDLFK